MSTDMAVTVKVLLLMLLSILLRPFGSFVYKDIKLFDFLNDQHFENACTSNMHKNSPTKQFISQIYIYFLTDVFCHLNI